MTFKERFEKYPKNYKKLLIELQKEEEKDNNKYSLEKIDGDINGYLYDFIEIIRTIPRRWWNDIIVVKKVNNMYFKYDWAENTGDESLYDMGWFFDIGSVKIVTPHEKTITIIEYK